MRSRLSVDVISWLTVLSVSRISTLRSAISRLALCSAFDAVPARLVRMKRSSSSKASPSFLLIASTQPTSDSRSMTATAISVRTRSFALRDCARPARIVFVGDANAFAVVRELADDSLTRIEDLPLEGGRIVSRLMHQFERFVGMQKPDVHRFAIQDFLELGRHQRQKLLHLERRGENLLQIVELRQARDGTQRVVAFGFVLLRGNQRSSGRFRDLDERFECIRRRFVAKAKHFHAADQVFAMNQRDVANRAHCAARIDVRIIFALQFGRGPGDRLGVAIEKIAQQAGVGRDRLFVDRGIADNRPGHPEILVSPSRNRVNTSG